MLIALLLPALLGGLAGDPREELLQLCQPLVEADGYVFRSTSDSEGGRFGGGEGESGEPHPVTGRFQKDAPLHLATGEFEAYREGPVFVYRKGEGDWQPLDRSGFGRGGWSEDGPSPEMLERMTLFRLRGWTPPHVLLTDLGDKLAAVEVADQEGDRRTFTAALTPDGTVSLFGRGRFGRGGGGPEFERSGELRLIVTQGGALESIEVQTRVKGEFRGREFDRTQKTRYEVSALGETKVEVPEAARKALAAATPPPEDEV